MKSVRNLDVKCEVEMCLNFLQKISNHSKLYSVHNVVNSIFCYIEEYVRLLLKFFQLPLLSILLKGSIFFDIVPLINLSDRFVYSSGQTLYLNIIWCTSKKHKEIRGHANYLKFSFSRTYSRSA